MNGNGAEEVRRGRPRGERERITVRVSAEIASQIRELSGVYGIPCSSVISQAVAQWYRDDVRRRAGARRAKRTEAR